MGGSDAVVGVVPVVRELAGIWVPTVVVGAAGSRTADRAGRGVDAAISAAVLARCGPLSVGRFQVDRDKVEFAEPVSVFTPAR